MVIEFCLILLKNVRNRKTTHNFSRSRLFRRWRSVTSYVAYLLNWFVTPSRAGKHFAWHEFDFPVSKVSLRLIESTTELRKRQENPIQPLRICNQRQNHGDYVPSSVLQSNIKRDFYSDVYAILSKMEKVPTDVWRAQSGKIKTNSETGLVSTSRTYWCFSHIRKYLFLKTTLINLDNFDIKHLRNV